MAAADGAHRRADVAAVLAAGDAHRAAGSGRAMRISAVEELTARIGLAVHLGLLQPGERLPAVDEIAATFGVSSITVRRALGGLVARGILVGRRGRHGGTFVAADPDVARLEEFASYRLVSGEVYELLDQRRVLECGIAYLAAERATADDLDRLQRLVDAMQAAATWAEFRAHDPKFHLELAAIAGSARAAEDLLGVLGRLVRFYVPYPIEYLHGSNDDHRAVLAALRSRDAAAAAAVARRHVETLYDTVFVGQPLE
jgi:DNA-binding FadR family transcriptional regulator